MILEDVQKLVPGNLITLYELDMTELGGDIQRFHNYDHSIIYWQGSAYYPWAIESSGFERTGDTQQPNPSLSVGNIGEDGDGNKVTGVVTALCLAFDDLVGAKLIRHRTFAKYLDAENFGGVNPIADPDEHFPVETWIVSQKERETPEAVSFVLASPMSLDGVQLPRRQVIANVCGWLVMDSAGYGGYRGAGCGYTGTNYFDKDGNPVADPSLDKCGGRVSDCKKRFGENSPLSYGSFPSADRLS
ncbi:phage minor tail protein L [Vibrio fluvialis]|uniref:phage minor tail protein L n=1 Tax=Vibrio fluvialis TaxID=676 RepID=UPI003D7DCA2A